MKLNIGNERTYAPSFEISMYIRGLKGETTNKKKSFKSDNGYDICEFFEKNAGMKRKKKKKKTGK